MWHVDSGCSRHMTGDISCLQDFKWLDGGYVAFGSDSQGGKITETGKVSKGKMSKGKMTFSDVYYVEQLKYNLLSVSQVCDKKHSTLFIDTDCLFLAQDSK